MGWQNNNVYTKWQQGVKLTNILPTHVETNNILWLPLIISILICLNSTNTIVHVEER